MGPRRVFLGHTSELREFPAGRSFVAAAEAAIARSGDAVVDMAYFAARDDRPAAYCQARVRDCDVYVGLIGLRHGSSVLDRPDVSYTELEFDTATEAGLTRLLFLLDDQVPLPIPAARLLDADPQSQARQRAFRDRLLGAGLMVTTVASPEQLEVALLHALQATGIVVGAERNGGNDEFLARYRRHVADFHGKIEPPDFERRRRVPIADLYVAPSFADLAEGQSPVERKKLDIAELAAAVDHSVLLGDPGSGKTTTAHVLMYRYASDLRQPVPFLVTLRDYASGSLGQSVIGYLEHRLDAFYQCPPPPGTVNHLLLSGSALVIFDGLDELLDPAHRADVAAAIEQFCAEYPQAPVLVTSRSVGYDEARLDDRLFSRYKILGFSDDRAREYAVKWFGQEPDLTEANATTWADAFMAESSAVADLRSSPLLLALMCILYRGEGSLPRNRAEVYEQCANLLFRKWDARRRIHTELRAGHLVEPAIRHLAWWLLTCGSPEAAVTRRELVGEMARFLGERGIEPGELAHEAAAEFVDFCKGRMWVLSDVGTTTTGETLFSFTHRTFMEFFAAAQLAYGCDTPEQLARTLAPKLAKSEWEVVGELAVQIKDRTSAQGGQRVYAALLADRRHRAASGRSGILQFLGRALRSVDPLPATVRDLTRAVLDHLLGGDTNEFIRYAPLAWLLACSDNCCTPVSDEIAERVRSLVSSEDSTSHLTGLGLAVWLPCFYIGSKDISRAQAGDSQINFWIEFSGELVHAYAEEIAAAARYKEDIRHGALHSEVLTVKEILRLPGGLLSLLRQQRVSIYGFTWGAYVLSDLIALLHNCKTVPPDEKQMARYAEIFSAVGRYLTERPDLPWIAGVAEAWSMYSYWNEEPDGNGTYPFPSFDETAYLGAAATLLMSTEAVQDKILPPRGPAQLGLLGDVYPYIARRWHLDSEGELPELPVPAKFRQLFRDWAQGKVNLTEAQPGQTAD